jgi:hypothetical protein
VVRFKRRHVKSRYRFTKFSISNFCTLGGTEDFRFITDQGPGFKFGSLISLANGNENIPFT